MRSAKVSNSNYWGLVETLHLYSFHLLKYFWLFDCLLILYMAYLNDSLWAFFIGFHFWPPPLFPPPQPKKKKKTTRTTGVNNILGHIFECSCILLSATPNFWRETIQCEKCFFYGYLLIAHKLLGILTSLFFLQILRSTTSFPYFFSKSQRKYGKNIF